MCKLANVKKLLFLFLIFMSCDSSNDCGDIVDKYSTLTGKYYFTLVNRAGATTQSGSGGGGEAEVSKDVYDSFSIGDEYCLD